MSQFFRIKVSDDVRALAQTPRTNLQRRKMKRVTQGLRRLEAANSGSTKAFEHILDLAYGRKGKLKWELMKPILSDPDAQIPPRIILNSEKSRPPVYSPELKALLLSSDSRKTKALTAKSLDFPPALPPRVDPSSEDARLLGPFSKRREVNIRWRYFTKEWKKVFPPLQVAVKDSTSECDRTSTEDLSRAGVRALGMQGRGIYENVQAVAGPLTVPRPLTRKERLSRGTEVDISVQSRHPSRWLRRRYQELLGRLPILAYTPTRDKNKQSSGRYSVSLSSNALAPALRHDPSRYPEVEPVADLEWLEFAKGRDNTNKNTVKAQK
ncbi:hypothetical protein C0995_013738 [Termitomyces sp. Mi166|nr:hypothetical protein C0995_013738 [Termitomyces sp. Mi166\